MRPAGQVCITFTGDSCGPRATLFFIDDLIGFNSEMIELQFVGMRRGARRVRADVRSLSVPGYPVRTSDADRSRLRPGGERMRVPAQIRPQRPRTRTFRLWRFTRFLKKKTTTTKKKQLKLAHFLSYFSSSSSSVLGRVKLFRMYIVWSFHRHAFITSARTVWIQWHKVLKKKIKK